MSSIDDRRLFQLAVWSAMGYVPTTGHFPIYDSAGELVATSYGQQEIQDCDAPVIQVVGGVRAGKSLTVSMKLAEHLAERDGLIWIVGPDYAQAKAEFVYIRKALSLLGVLKGKPSEPEKGSQTLETIWGCRVETKSSADHESLASFAPTALLGVEMGQQTEEVRDKLSERALEKNAPIIMSGTIEAGQDWYRQQWRRWQGPNEEGGRSFSLPSWSNTAIFPGGRQDPKILRLEAEINDDDKFLERVAAVPFRHSNLVFRTFNPKYNVVEMDYDPSLPIEIAIDPGTRAYAVVAVQWRTLPLSVGTYIDYRSRMAVPKTEIRVVDEVYMHEAEAPEVIARVKDKPWFKAVTSGVIDQAGKTKNQGMKSQVQLWLDEAGIALRHNYVTIRNGIAVIRRRLPIDPQLGSPLLLFSHKLSDVSRGGRAEGIISEMNLYMNRPWVEGSSESEMPIDANNHAAKALGYWIYDKMGPTEERVKRGGVKIRNYF